MREADEGVTEVTRVSLVAAELIFDRRTLMMKPVTALIIILKSCLCIFLMFIKSLVNVYLLLIV